MAPMEIQALSKYLSDALLDPSQHVHAAPILAQKLQSRFFPHHWYPLEPERGSGYRAISFDPARQDGYLDPVLCILAQLLAISTRDLRRTILKNMGEAHSSGWTIWCDPGCVSIRLQASGGELRELWGNLPTHLSRHRIGYSPSPRPALSQRSSSSADSSSPNKSRAIPILAPTPGTRLALTPPTPIRAHAPVLNLESCAHEEEQEINNVQAMLTHRIQAQFQLASDRLLLEDRPASRASCASSSSDGSDNSAFSSSSSSTATSVAPLGFHLGKKLGASQLSSVLAPPLPARFIRHHSSSSFPFVSVTNASLLGFTSLAAIQAPPLLRAASPMHRGQRRPHMPSSSVSGPAAGRGSLVLKGGPGTVTEHSGGKVGVMGGGVLLGLPKANSTVSNSARRMPNRRTRTGPANS